MRPNVYDRQGAGSLVPLLRSITTEMLERTRTIEALEGRLDPISRTMDRSARARIEGQLAGGRSRGRTQARARRPEARGCRAPGAGSRDAADARIGCTEERRETEGRFTRR